ncbi:hypothetical protein KR093_005576, partial [Drosophila rubida]
VMDNVEANQIMQRLNNLKIVDTPRQQQRENGNRECQSEIVRKTQVPATPSTGPSSFQTELKKRRKMKLNRVYKYESDIHFIKARKSLNF